MIYWLTGSALRLTAPEWGQLCFSGGWEKAGCQSLRGLGWARLSVLEIVAQPRAIQAATGEVVEREAAPLLLPAELWPWPGSAL